jgi:hypothetical protein
MDNPVDVLKGVLSPVVKRPLPRKTASLSLLSGAIENVIETK